MSDQRPDEGARRWWRRAAREAEEADVAARVRRAGLGEGRLAALLTVVEVAIDAGGCDHALTHTRRWLEVHRVDPELALDLLVSMGGRCDCEVVLNVEVPLDHDGSSVPDTLPATSHSRPPARRPERARPVGFADDVLRWDVPCKPWRADHDPRGALVVLRYGKGLVASLVAAAPSDPAADEAWCWSRWEQSQRHAGDDERARAWRRGLGYVAHGPESVALEGGLTGRRWRIGAPDRTNVMLWIVLDVRAPRTLEVETSVQREAGDLRELEAALRSLRPA